MRTLVTTVVLAVLVLASALAVPGELCAAPRPRGKPAPQKPAPRTPEQREADRHFKSGVALFQEAKYGEALAEFERAYEIAPHPLVLYNIAGCHRQLSHYAEAVAYYRRFLDEGRGAVAGERLAAAQAELDAILSLVARVTVTLSPPADGAALSVDGAPLGHPEMPLILPPGEHRLSARAPGRRDAERTVRVASGDAIAVELELPPPAPPPETPPTVARLDRPAEAGARTRPHRRFAVNAGFGTNLRLARDTGAPSLGVAVSLGSRLELGIDAVLVAYAVIPSLRVRVVGDALALHVIGAVPVALSDGSSSDRFAAAAVGLGLRYRPLPRVAVRLESYAAFADRMHGVAIPTFLGGELWF